MSDASQSDAAFEEELHQADDWYVPVDIHAGEAREKRGKREKKVQIVIVYAQQPGMLTAKRYAQLARRTWQQRDRNLSRYCIS